MSVEVLQGPVDLRAVRAEAGLSAAEVGSAVAVHATTVLRWERLDRFPGPAHLRRLADAYGLPLPTVSAFFDRARTPAGVLPGCPGRGLRRLRRLHHLPAATLAERLAVPTHRIYNWEAGRARIPTSHLDALAETFSLDVGTLQRLLRRWSEWRAPSDPPSTPLRRLRRQAGLTQSELAQRAGVGLTSLKSWERGAPVSLQGVRGIARALELPAVTVTRAAGLSLPRELQPSLWRRGDLPRVLATLRQWSQLTQQELAEMCGCSVSSVRAWESGRLRPAPARRCHLESLYRLDPGSLLVTYGAGHTVES